MFAWYKKAAVCYAYLSDVSDPVSSSDTPAMLDSRLDDEFRGSQWFGRGWTLQELLAPSYIDFFSKSWTWLGTKSSLRASIMNVTGIHDLWDYEGASVAQKMSWASKRTTTRLEDRAYSLLGLFGVYMPPLYGEGEYAFIRLQLHILDGVDDDSIFGKLSEISWYIVLRISFSGFEQRKRLTVMQHGKAKASLAF